MGVIMNCPHAVYQKHDMGSIWIVAMGEILLVWADSGHMMEFD